MLRRYSPNERLRLAVAETLRLSRSYVLATILIMAATFWLLRLGASPPTNKHTAITVQIPKGATRPAVAAILRGRELIRSRTAFAIITHVGYEGRPFVPGTYVLRTDMSLFRILDKIISGDVAKERVTIPEGFTVRQIAARLQKRKVTDAQAFLQLAQNQASKFGISSPTGSLEGYLFPDTYTFFLGIPAQQAVQTMVDTFKKRMTQLDSKELANPAELHKTVTIASLVEKEARLNIDRSLIASVILNRMKKRMPLQIDATVLFAMRQHKNRILYKDLNIESPYNTYKIRGLPPGPIANPGIASIDAALHPAQTDYLYYVAQPDGTHKFARTFQEHIANKPTH